MVRGRIVAKPMVHEDDLESAPQSQRAESESTLGSRLPGQRHALPIHREAVLATGFASIGRVRAGMLSTAFGTHTDALDVALLQPMVSRSVTSSYREERENPRDGEVLEDSHLSARPARASRYFSVRR